MTRIRVSFADTDAMGIVHHANYLKYFEISRVEWLREKGMNYTDWVAKGLHLPLIESHCLYKKAARFDDLLEITVTPKIDGIRMTMEYDVKNQKTGEIIATGSTKHVCVDNNLKVLPLPQEVQEMVNGGNNGS